MSNIKRTDGHIVKRDRDSLWVSLDSPPVIVIHCTVIHITKEGEKFEAAVETLMNAKEIGVSIQFEAQLLPRDGSLSLLCVDLGDSGARLKGKDPSLYYIKKKGDMFEDVIEKLQLQL